MLGMIDWAAGRARMVLAFVILTLAAGVLAYTGLPKEGEPDIEVPALFISVPFQGISAADSETLLVRPMEQELAGPRAMPVWCWNSNSGGTNPP